MLKINYKIVGTGWAECKIDDGVKEFIITASYLGDALAELADGVLDILKGKNKAIVYFEEEPGQFRWVFKREGNNMEIKIMVFDDCWSKEKDEEGKLIFLYVCTIDEFITATLKCFDGVMKRYSLKAYKEKWCSDFPMKTYEEIKKLSKLI